MLTSHLGETQYYHRYRNTVVLPRMMNEDTLHSATIIKISGVVKVGTLMELVVREFEMNDASRVFDPIKPVSNRSREIIFAFTQITFPGSKDGERIG